MADEFTEKETFVFRKTLDSDSHIAPGGSLDSDMVIADADSKIIHSNATIIPEDWNIIHSDMVLLPATSGTLDSDMVIVDAGSKLIHSNSYIVKIGVPDKLNPLQDTEYNLSDSSERIRFIIPDTTADSNVDIHIQIASDENFNNVLWDFFSWQDSSRWEYWNGSSFVSWPSDGVPPAYYGNEGRFKIQGPEAESLINRGRWHWRIRTIIR